MSNQINRLLNKRIQEEIEKISYVLEERKEREESNHSVV